MRSQAPADRARPVGCNVTWLDSLSPWPTDGFGLDRMRAFLAALGDPQLGYEAVHVVGTNGKSTATRRIEALLLAGGFSVGATISPHVRSWAERITIDGAETDIEGAVGAVRPFAERIGATQFETITAAALTAFAAAEVDAAVVEAGLGGRLDATNVLRSRVVLLTNVSLEHTDVLGETVEEIAPEKLAVAHPESIVVVPDNWFGSFVPAVREIVVGGAREAAEAFAGHAIDADPPITLPGRLEPRGTEIRDGAHNPEGARWLVEHLPEADYAVCASILGDKDVDGMLRELARVGSRFVATTASNPRALIAHDLAAAAEAHFPHVETVVDPREALARAHELADAVLVTGSLYLLADLEQAEAEGR
jgi:dihydrofolate synthase/folylpolyglutamate synthase